MSIIQIIKNEYLFNYSIETFPTKKKGYLIVSNKYTGKTLRKIVISQKSALKIQQNWNKMLKINNQLASVNYKTEQLINKLLKRRIQL